jgi:hypothetical protein
MRRIHPVLTLLAVSLAFSTCTLLSGRCLYETRNVMAEGRVLESNAEIASAQVILHEQRDYEPDKDFGWQILGPQLKGHTTRITLRDNAAPSTVFYEFPIHSDPRMVLASGTVRQSEGANISGFFDLLSSGRAIVVITTDLPERPTVTIALSSVSREDWSRPYCS